MSATAKEHLGGFYIVDANDSDEALSWASKISARSRYQRC